MSFLHRGDSDEPELNKNQDFTSKLESLGTVKDRKLEPWVISLLQRSEIDHYSVSDLSDYNPFRVLGLT